MVVLPARGAEEHGAAAELLGNDLEAEDVAVELGRYGRVSNVEHGVIESRDVGHCRFLRCERVPPPAR
jgi:hypothetical protein